jgi:hypothetical protein
MESRYLMNPAGPASEGNDICGINVIFYSYFQLQSHRLTSGIAGRPGPLKIKAAELAGYINNFANKI